MREQLKKDDIITFKVFRNKNLGKVKLFYHGIQGILSLNKTKCNNLLIGQNVKCRIIGVDDKEILKLEFISEAK